MMLLSYNKKFGKFIANRQVGNHRHRVNLQQARFNMIEQQVRTWAVLDQRVLDAMASVPREEFVPSRWRSIAFADTQVPLDHGQVMMAPKVEGRLLQALSLKDSDRVLEIGTGTGYLSALLATLAERVFSIDIYDDFIATATTTLGKLGVPNVHLDCADGLDGLPAGAPYDAIAVTGSAIDVIDAWREQLAPGGRLFAVIGEAPVMEARLITRVGPTEWASEALFETRLPPLVGAGPKPKFRF
jgi:protein-L-isoaspartate(D-aspartate) O-methyltransferase